MLNLLQQKFSPYKDDNTPYFGCENDFAGIFTLSDDELADTSSNLNMSGKIPSLLEVKEFMLQEQNSKNTEVWETACFE